MRLQESREYRFGERIVRENNRTEESLKGDTPIQSIVFFFGFFFLDKDEKAIPWRKDSNGPFNKCLGTFAYQYAKTKSFLCGWYRDLNKKTKSSSSPYSINRN
jgi:hypothetical protein